MKIRKITSQEFADYLAQTKLRHFYNQTPDILDFDRAQGLEVELLGLWENEEIRSVFKLTSRPELRVYRQAQVNWLPLDLAQPGLLPDLIQALEAYLRAQKNYLRLSFAPLVVRGIYRGDGEENYQPEALAPRVDKIFEEAGYHHFTDDFYSDTSLQPRYIFVKDIRGKSEEEVMASLDSKVRNHIRVAERYGMTLRNLKPEEAHVFNQALTAMADNYGFPRNRLNLTSPEVIKAAGDRVRYVAICLKPQASLVLNSQIGDELKAEQAATDESSRRGKIKIRELEQQIMANQKRRERIEELADLHGLSQELILGVSQFGLSPSDYICLQTAIFADFVDLSPAYYMHGVMLKEAVAQGADYYNLFAVSDPLEPQDDLGVLNFKKQFNGQVEEYVGNYAKDLAEPATAKLLKLAKKVKNKFRS